MEVNNSVDSGKSSLQISQPDFVLGMSSKGFPGCNNSDPIASEQHRQRQAISSTEEVDHSNHEVNDDSDPLPSVTSPLPTPSMDSIHCKSSGLSTYRDSPVVTTASINIGQSVHWQKHVAGSIFTIPNTSSKPQGLHARATQKAKYYVFQQKIWSKFVQLILARFIGFEKRLDRSCLTIKDREAYMEPKERAPNTKGLLSYKSSNKGLSSFCCKLSRRLHTLLPPLTTTMIAIAVLSTPVAALDDQIVLAAYPMPNVQPRVIPDHRLQLPVGIISTFILVVAGCMSTIARNLLGPLMGVSSVLWFMMRNDAAIRPGLSWTVFSIWAFATLSYLSYQTRRVVHDRLYILLALASSGVCLCIIALVQKASIQGGLVTAVPPCTSFAAYAVAFFFPDRRRIVQEYVV